MHLPCGTFSETYAQDMTIMKTKLQWFLLLTAVIFFLTFPLFSSSYVLTVTITIGITIIAVLGLNLLTGYCGQISVAHSAFMGVGAYTSAVLVGSYGFPFWVALPCAAICAGLAGLVFGSPSLRLKGFYLVMATLAAQAIIPYIIARWSGVTGGVYGLRVPSPSIGGMVFDTYKSYYYIVFIALLAATFFARNLARSRIGRAFVAIRDNDLAAGVMGISPFRHKMLAFFIGCAYAGLAGSLWAHWVNFICIENFTLMLSIWYLGYIVVGGLGTTVGPFFGVVFIILLIQGLSLTMTNLGGAYPEAIGLIAPLKEVIFGLVVILFLIFEPRGLAHRWNIVKRYYRLWPFSY